MSMPMTNGAVFTSEKDILKRLPPGGSVAAVRVSTGFKVFNAAIFYQLRKEKGEENVRLITKES